MVNDIAFGISSAAFEPDKSALAPPLATKLPCEIIYDETTGKYDVITNDAAIDFWNRKTVRSVKAGETLGKAFRNRWAFVDVGYLIAQMLKLTRDPNHKIQNPKNILIPLIKRHISNRNGMAEILLEGYDIDGIEELREGSEITGFVLPVNRNSKHAYNLVYNLQSGDMSIPMSNDTKVWVKVETVGTTQKIEPMLKEPQKPAQDSIPGELKSAFGVSGTLENFLRDHLKNHDKITGFDFGAGDGEKTCLLVDLLKRIGQNVNFVGLENEDDSSVKFSRWQGKPVEYSDVRNFLKPDCADKRIGKCNLITMLWPHIKTIPDFVATAKKLIAPDGVILISLLKKDMEDLFNNKLILANMEKMELQNALKDFQLIEFTGLSDDKTGAEILSGNRLVFIYSGTQNLQDSALKQPESGGEGLNTTTIMDFSFPIGSAYKDRSAPEARKQLMKKLIADIESKIDDERKKKIPDVIFSPCFLMLDPIIENAVDAVFERMDDNEIDRESAVIVFKIFADEKGENIYIEVIDNGVGIDSEIIKGWEENRYKSTKQSDKKDYFVGGKNHGMRYNFPLAAKDNIELSIETKTKGMPGYSITQDINGQKRVAECGKKDVGTKLTLKSKISFTPQVIESGKTVLNSIPTVVSPESERTHAMNLTDSVNYMQAEEDTQPLIIAVGTSWIKGYEQGKYLQYDALNPLLSSMAKCDEFRKTKFIIEDDEELLTEIIKKKGEKGFENAKIIALAGEKTIMEDLAQLDDGRNILLGVDNTYLTEDSYIRIMEMLEIAAKLALNPEIPPSSPNMGVIRKGKFWILIPRAEPMDYEKQKVIYEVQRFA